MAAPRSDRFSPSDLNNLIKQLELKSERKSVQMSAKHSFNQQVPYFISNKDGLDRFIVFNVTKDSKTLQNEQQLPFIGEVIAKFRDAYPAEKGTLLIPMRQCRGYFKLPTYFTRAKKAHIVLVEVNLEKKEIIVHDSQGSDLQYTIYPDTMKRLASEWKMKYQFNGYQTQNDDVHCGYYVHQYIMLFLNITLIF